MIAPIGHCAYKRATEHTVVGERNMGDARLGLRRAHVRMVRSLPEGRETTTCSTPCLTCATTRWAATSGSPPTRGRPRVRSR